MDNFYTLGNSKHLVKFFEDTTEIVSKCDVADAECLHFSEVFSELLTELLSKMKLL